MTMKPFHPVLFVATVLATVFLSANRAGAQNSETSWTSVEGVTIWARFAGVEGENVILVRSGQEYRVPLRRLAPESVAKARRLLDPAAKTDSKSTAHDNVTRIPLSGSKALLPARPSTPIPGGIARDRHAMPVYDFSERRRMVRTTAYTSGESDHLIYGNRNAVGTALLYTDRIRSAAADWSFYPVGTMFSIKGLPYVYVVDDYGSALVGTGTIDIYQPTMGCMKQWGRRNVEVTILRWGSLGRSAEILRTRQGHSHCRRMLENILRQRSQLASR